MNKLPILCPTGVENTLPASELTLKKDVILSVVRFSRFFFFDKSLFRMSVEISVLCYFFLFVYFVSVALV